MISLTDLEKSLLDALLAGDHPALAVLRAQFAAATATHREMSGVGFFTHFEVPPSVSRLDTKHWVLSDIYLELPALTHGADIMLFIINGAISMLEGVTLGSDDWPADELGFSIGYFRRHRPIHPAGWECVRSATRDLAMLDDEYRQERSRG